MAIPIPVIDGLMRLGTGLIDRFFPDPAKAAEAQMELAKMYEAGDLQRLGIEAGLLQGQIEVNKIEAASENLFKSGWRPAIGWTCAVSLFCYYVPYVLAATVMWVISVYQTGFLVPRPDLGIADLMGLLFGMLGIAGMRTVERLNDKIPKGK